MIDDDGIPAYLKIAPVKRKADWDAWHAKNADKVATVWVDPVEAHQKELLALQAANEKRRETAALPARVADLEARVAAIDPRDHEKTKRMGSLLKSLKSKLNPPDEVPF
jgi:hypothetical protein